MVARVNGAALLHYLRPHCGDLGSLSPQPAIVDPVSSSSAHRASSVGRQSSSCSLVPMSTCQHRILMVLLQHNDYCQYQLATILPGPSFQLIVTIPNQCAGIAFS